jgi:hypothetical protein
MKSSWLFGSDRLWTISAPKTKALIQAGSSEKVAHPKDTQCCFILQEPMPLLLEQSHCYYFISTRTFFSLFALSRFCYGALQQYQQIHHLSELDWTAGT